MQQPFRVGEHFLVEPPLNRVTGPRGVNRLEPKVMVVLVCLAEHAGEMVPKNRLLQAAWPDTAVSDDVLTRAISELRRLFEDDSKQPHTIETIAKGGYRLIAPVGVVAPQVGPLWSAAGELVPDSVPAATAAVSAGPSLPQPSRRAAFGAVGASAVVLLALAGAWQLRGRPTTSVTPVPAMRVVALTAMSGSEYGPSFSPDGRQVAFGWNGENRAPGTRPWWEGNWGIYVKLVGSSEVRQLTTGPGVNLAPAWSPDGRQIAFVRLGPSPRIRVVSSLGGPDRQVSDFPAFLPVRWSPDGRYVVAGRARVPDPVGWPNGIYLIPVDGGDARMITRPKPSGQDLSPAFSPDGRRLAYVSCPGQGPDSTCHLRAIDVDASFGAVGSPRTLRGPPYPGERSGLTWSRDGRSVIFNAEENQLSYLWRVATDGESVPERLEHAGVNGFWPAASPTGHRLAFTRQSHDQDVYRFEPGRPSRPVAPSPLFDGVLQFSPDGRRIAFSSLRSGEAMEVWVANADGSSAAQLTHGPDRFKGDPSWSPDGQRIAFDSAGEHAHIWTVDSEGGTPRQITRDPGDQISPTWSRDGVWLYYSWSQPGDRNIWRVRVATGSKERVTRGGGFIASESADGKAVLYISKPYNSPLMAQALDGGSPHTIIPCVAGTAFSVNQTGVYYLPCAKSETPDPNPLVHVIDPATGKVQDLGRLEGFHYDALPSSFAVSPDGRTILYGRLVRDEADLMLIEHFR